MSGIAPPDIDEADKVVRWRRSELLRALGGDYLDAVDKLAAADADLHQILSAAANGCDPQLLLRIFG